MVSALAVGLGAELRWAGTFFFCLAAVSFGFAGALLGTGTVNWIRRLLADRPLCIVSPDTEFSFTLGMRAEIVIGRHRECDVVIPFDSVSLRHCRLIRRGRHWYIEDLKSTNGTYVDGQRTEKTLVKVGSRLGIADHEFIVR